jgi:phospholipid transport system substrate-binding protein
MIASVLVFGTLTITGAPDRALAAAPEAARDFIMILSEDAVSVIADPSMDKEKRLRELHRLFVQGFDTRTIGRFVLGPHWRAASEQQLNEYVRLFEAFVVQSYAERLGEYAGERLEVKKARIVGSNGDVMVSSAIVRPSGPPVRVDWRVRALGNGHKIVDVIVEGVSMLITQRDEFASVIRASGGQFEGLLTALRKKTTSY